jgi:hypothetical protein
MRPCRWPGGFDLHQSAALRSVSVWRQRSMPSDDKEKPMLSPLKYALPVAGLLAFQPAQAQMLGPLWETYVTLTQGDLNMIKTDLDNQIHNKQAGAIATWRNEASGNSGRITLLKSFTRAGHRCEDIDYVISPSEKALPSDHYVFTSCVQPDGSWKLS